MHVNQEPSGGYFPLQKFICLKHSSQCKSKFNQKSHFYLEPSQHVLPHSGAGCSQELLYSSLIWLVYLRASLVCLSAVCVTFNPRPKPYQRCSGKQGRSPVRSQTQATETSGLEGSLGTMAGVAADPATCWFVDRSWQDPGAGALRSGSLKRSPRVSSGGPSVCSVQERRRSDFLCFGRMPLGLLQAFYIPDGLPHLPPLRALGL